MDKAELAKWIHDNYEEIAKEQNWDTQENCKVEFDALPDENKRTMIELAKRVQQYAQQMNREIVVDFYMHHLNYPIDKMHILKEFDNWKSNQEDK